MNARLIVRVGDGADVLEAGCVESASVEVEVEVDTRDDAVDGGSADGEPEAGGGRVASVATVARTGAGGAAFVGPPASEGAVQAAITANNASAGTSRPLGTMCSVWQ